MLIRGGHLRRERRCARAHREVPPDSLGSPFRLTGKSLPTHWEVPPDSLGSPSRLAGKSLPTHSSFKAWTSFPPVSVNASGSFLIADSWRTSPSRKSRPRWSASPPACVRAPRDLRQPRRPPRQGNSSSTGTFQAYPGLLPGFSNLSSHPGPPGGIAYPRKAMTE